MTLSENAAELKVREDKLEDHHAMLYLVELLVLRRQQLGLTQEQVAHRMGSDQSTISEFENKKTGYHVSTLQRYARAVDCRLDFEIQLTDDVKPEPQHVSDRFRDEQIDRIHGPGAAAALDRAIADGSVFSDSSRSHFNGTIEE